METGSVYQFEGEEEFVRRADDIRRLSAHVHAAQARLATMLAEFTADGWWNATGDWRSVAHWLVINCGFTTSEATALARVAAASGAMPIVMQHAMAGEVSLGVASLVSRVAAPEVDQTLANIAVNATPTQAAYLVAKYRTQKRRLDAERERVAAADGVSAEDAPADGDGEPGSDDGSGDEAAAVEESFWRSWFDDDGRWRVEAGASAEVGALLDAAYAAARHDVEGRADDVGADQAPSGAAEPVTGSAVDAPGRARPAASDIMRGLADLALDTARSRRRRDEGGEHFGVTVLVDIDTLVSGRLRPDSVCKLESGPHVSPGLVRRLAEAGALQVLWHQKGIPLKLGTAVRLASRHQRRLLRFRDGGCTVPGCGQQRRLHAHHIEVFPAGPTDLDNLVFLCSFHHRLIHHGGWTITTDGFQNFVFRDGRGEYVGNRLVGQVRASAPVVPLESLDEHRSIPITGSTPRPGGGYDPLTDFAANVWVHALLSAEPPGPPPGPPPSPPLGPPPAGSAGTEFAAAS